MTVVSYLKLSQKVGMGCADERETIRRGSSIRSYDLADKICRQGLCILGQAGTVPNELAILERLEKGYSDSTKEGPPKPPVKKDDRYEAVRKAVVEAYHDARTANFEEEVLRKYMVTMERFLAGDPKSELWGAIRRQLEDPGFFDVSMLLMGIAGDGDVGLCYVRYPGVADETRNYFSIGSGGDRADIVIGDYFDSLDPDGRRKIQKYEGAKILMKATESAWRNIGVGGHTRLVWIDGESLENPYNELGTAESNILNNVLYCERKGVISREKATETFKAVIEDGAKAAELIKDLVGEIGSNKIAELFFLQSLHL